MDISVSGGAPAKEVASAAKSGKSAGKSDAAGHKSGFFDALTKANNDASGAEANAADTVEADIGHADKPAHAAHSHSAAKPVIDIGKESLKVQAEKIAGSKNAAKFADAGKLAGKPGRDQGEAADQTAAEKFITDGLPAKAGVQTGKSVKTTKADATDSRGKSHADDSAVSDALGLLNKDAPISLDASAAMTVAANMADKSPRTSTSDKKTDATAAKGGDKIQPHAADALAAISGGNDDTRIPGTESADATDGKTFKLSRADGRGQTMAMRVGADDDDAKGAGKKGDVENVTVLDSRRYIGLAQNSAAVTAAISGDHEWASAMQPSSTLSNAAEWTSTGKVVNTLKIQMNPLDLGLVTATMRLSGDALNIDLKVETGAAYRQLKEDHSKIIEALRGQGYAIDNVSISMAPVIDKQDSSSQSNGQGQAFQQSSAQEGHGGAARERNNQTQWTDGGFNGAGETGVEDASAGSAGGGSSGGVYL